MIKTASNGILASEPDFTDCSIARPDSLTLLGQYTLPVKILGRLQKQYTLIDAFIFNV